MLLLLYHRKTKDAGTLYAKDTLEKMAALKDWKKKKDQSKNADKTHSKALASYETYNALCKKQMLLY